MITVAPRVGAWIETGSIRRYAFKEVSHPVWVRGLKQLVSSYKAKPIIVAPRVGAWIETTARRKIRRIT